jgi:hypothetical protein
MPGVERQVETARWSPDEEFFKIYYGLLMSHAQLAMGCRTPTPIFEVPERLQQLVNLNRELWALLSYHYPKEKDVPAKLALLVATSRELQKRIEAERATGSFRGLEFLTDDLYQFLEALGRKGLHREDET